jgi:hypothetical protein
MNKDTDRKTGRNGQGHENDMGTNADRDMATGRAMDWA